MVNTLFTAQQFTPQALDWRQAIRLACFPLEEHGFVSPDYAQSIIHSTEQHGAWYVLSPEFALPHARPEEGVLSQQSRLSMLCSAEKIAFPGFPSIRFIVVLAAANSEQHVETIQRLVCWLDEDQRLAQFSAIDTRARFDALTQNL